MRKLLIPVAAGLALLVGASHAQVQKITPQQDKLAVCGKAAGNKTGNDRKSFISSCMTAQSVSTQSVTTQSLVGRQDNKSMMVSGCEHGSRAEDL